MAQVSKKSDCNAGDLGFIPGMGRFPEAGHGNPLQYSCLESPHKAPVHGVAKNRTRLSDKAHTIISKGFPGGANGKEFTCQCRRCKRSRFDSWMGSLLAIRHQQSWKRPEVFSVAPQVLPSCIKQDF